MSNVHIEVEPPRGARVTTLKSPTPRSKRDRGWRKHAKKARWVAEDGIVTYESPKKWQGFEVFVGDEPGDAAGVMLVRGYIVTSKGSFVVDHYVFVDAAGTPVSPAVRRTGDNPDPEASWWPIREMQGFFTRAGVPLRHDTARSAADLAARYPGVFDSELGL